MSKIFFKVNNNSDEKKNNEALTKAEEKKLPDEQPVKAEAAAASAPTEAVQIALFPDSEEHPSDVAQTQSDGKEAFDKKKIVKYFKRHPKKKYKHQG